MTDSKSPMMEVPPQLREMALKTVDQAQAATASFMQSAIKSIDAAPAPLGSLAKQTFALSERNIMASYEHARKLMKAKDLAEVMQLQVDFVRSQFQAATEQFTHMTSAAGNSSATEAVKTQTIDIKTGN